MTAARLRRLLVCFALPAALACAAGAQTALPAAGSAAQTPPAQADLRLTTRLTGHLPVWANAALDAGPADEKTVLHLDFTLARPPAVQAAFDQLLIDQQTPGNARFHQWLTPQQIGQFYGPAQADVDVLTAWLTAQGFQIDEVTPSRGFVRVSAPVATASAALATSFRMFNVSGAVGVAPTPHLSAATEPAIPTAFTSLVQSIAGLSDVPDQPMSHMGAASRAGSQAAASPQPALTNGSGNHYIAPGDFATIYDVPSQATTATDGTGQKVAIIGRSQVLAADITNFQALTGLTAKLPNVIIPVGAVDPGLPYTGDQSEATLDVQRVAGSAPGAQVDLIVATNASGGIRAAIQYNVQTVLDPVMNISFGACEANAGLANVNLYANLFAQAAAEGISVFVSSADSGVATCDTQFATAPATQFVNINYICSSGFATCVGATEFNDTANPNTYWSSGNAANLSSALSYIPEGTWNEPTVVTNNVTSYIVQAGGGGVSMYTAKPAFQAGNGVPADGFRDVPDVSFSGSGHDGYFGCYAGPTGASGSCVVTNGTYYFTYFAGTSAAAPGMAAVTALLNQRAGTSQGNMNPLIYRLAASSTAGAFHDATIASSGVTNCTAAVPSMCNNSTPSPTALTGGQPGYLLTTGFDLATGWGSLDIGKFLTAAVTAGAPTKTTLSGSQGNIAAGAALNFTVTVAPVKASSTAPTGNVQFFLNGTVYGSPVSLSGTGTATFTGTNNLPLGSNLVSAVYAGDATFSSSTAVPLTLNITSGTSPTTTVFSATPNPGVTTQTLVLNATVATQNGTAPTGTVNFYYNNTFLTSAPVSKGVATVAGYTFSAYSYTFYAVYTGDGSNASSTSATVSQIVNAGPTTTTLTGPASVGVGVGFSLTVTVADSVFAGAAKVLINDGATTLVPVTTSTTISGTTQTLTLTFGGLTQGVHSLTAAYQGDTNDLPSTSKALIVVVGTPPGVTLTPAAAALTLAAGSGTGNTDVLTLSSTGNFTGALALTCSVAYAGSGTPTAAPTCSLTNPSVTLAAGGTGTSTLTLFTTAPHSVSGGKIAGLRNLESLLAMALLLGILPLARRGSRRRLDLLLALVAGVLLTGAIGCGGGGNSPTTPAPLSGGTTTGSYTITVNGAGMVNGYPVTATATINLLIQ